MYGVVAGARTPVANTLAKLPFAWTAAVCVTPFSVTAIVPVGTRAPNPIVPSSAVVAVPASMVGDASPVNDGVAFAMAIVSLIGVAAL